MSQRSDFLILDADDGQQLEHDQKKEHRNTNERERVVLNAENLGHPSHAIRPESQADEGETDEKEQKCVAFFELIRAQSSNGQQQEQATEGRQENVLEDVHSTSPFLWARGHARGPAAGKR